MMVNGREGIDPMAYGGRQWPEYNYYANSDRIDLRVRRGTPPTVKCVGF